MQHALATPWKLTSALQAILAYLPMRLVFAANGLAWQRGWRFYGIPIIQKHRDSSMLFGENMHLRSSIQSNPLGANHPVVFCTWQAGAVLHIGADFGMTGGSITAAESITIGDRVVVGANSTISDTDFHPLDAELRRLRPQEAKSAPILIEEDVFIGMNCLVLKGVSIGRASVIGAGSVVTNDVPAGVIVAGNPARVIGPIRRS